MNDLLLDYLLDRLDLAEKRQVEIQLQVNPETRRRLELLRQALAPLAADDEIAPPPRLAARTIARVAEHVCRELPRAPAPPRSEAAGRPWWRRADVLVAASLLAVFVGVGVPLLLKLRAPGSAFAVAECQNNLRVFHNALKTYEDQHRKLPSLPPAPHNIAGMIVPLLQDAGTLPTTFSVRCPGHGPLEPSTLTLDDIRGMTIEEFSRQAPNLLMSYAFTLGYRDEDGVWHPLERRDDLHINPGLVFADNPPPNAALAATSNSLNHGRKGQNVLYLDGHVQFLTLRTVGGDDIYLNRANQIAAGLDSRDFVLGASAAKP
jgi:prepilin-type processing-associated H-X9-DG protein